MKVCILKLLPILLLITSSVEAKENIKIALLAGFSGVASIPSYHLLHTVEMEIAKVNESGGIGGRQIELRIFDDESNPVKTLEFANDARLDDVVGIIGFPWSQFILTAGPILQRRGIPSISILATHDDVTKIGDYIFRVCFNDTYQGTKLAQFAVSNTGAKKALLFVNQQNAYSVHLAKVIREEFASKGGSIIKQIDYIPQNNSNFFMERLKEIDIGGYDSVFLPDDQVYVMPIMKAFIKTGGNDKRFFGGDGWNMANILIRNNQLNDFETYVIGHWDKNEADVRNKRFISEFKSLYPSEPQDASALSHDAFYVLIEAIRKTPSLDKKQLKENLYKTSYNGLTGKIQFKTTGDPIHKPLVIHRAYGGKRESLVYQ